MYRFAHLIPFYPLFQFIRIQLKWGLVHPSKWSVIVVWLIKIIVFEPLRLLDTIVIILLPEREIQPIFIIGYYRSGTTYLQELMTLDKKHTTMSLFTSILPEISFLFGWLFIPLFNVIAKLLKIKNQYHNVPFRFDFPGEEDVGLNALSSYRNYNRIYQYPSQYEKITKEYLIQLNSKSKKAFIENYKFLLKKIAYSSSNKIIVLKSPPNLARTELLHELFPNAKFIHIHRDPYTAIISARRLWKLNRSFSFENYSNDKVDKILVHQYVSFYNSFYSAKESKDILTINFNSLVNETEKTIYRIYKELGLDGYEDITSLIHKNIESSRSIPRNNNLQELSPEIINSTNLREIRKSLGYLD